MIRSILKGNDLWREKRRKVVAFLSYDIDTQTRLYRRVNTSWYKENRTATEDLRINHEVVA